MKIENLAEVNDNVEHTEAPSGNERKALIWRCVNGRGNNAKKHGKGCYKFNVRMTRQRSGNAKNRFLGRCCHCPKTTALNPESGSIIMWLDSKEEADLICEQMNSGLV